MKLSLKPLKGKPAWQIILRGAAIPGAIVAACVLIGVIYAAIRGFNVEAAMEYGVLAGLFISLVGVLDIVVAIFISSKDIKTNSLLALGYMIVWAICVSIVFY